MKFRAWTDIFISIVMLIISGYLLADASVMSLALLSNPNLNVAIELVRFFWGTIGTIYFLYYLYHGVTFLRNEHHESIQSDFRQSVKSPPRRKSPKKRRSRKRRRRKRKSSK